MEWGERGDRVDVVALHRYGKKPKEIFNFVKLFNITIKFFYRAIKWSCEHSTIGDQTQPGHLRSSRTPEVIKTVRDCIRRNHLRKQKMMARELSVSIGIISQIIRDDLHMKAYHWSVGHRLDTRLKKNQV